MEIFYRNLIFKLLYHIVQFRLQISSLQNSLRRKEIVIEAPTSIFTLVKTITTPAITGKKTADCFMKKLRYSYRDSDMDNWLPENQSEQPESHFLVQELGQNAKFRQAVESFRQAVESFLVLVQTGDIKNLSQLLKDCDHITTLPTIESFIEWQEAGDDFGLRTDGWWNLFFVENKNGSVLFVRVGRYGGRWSVSAVPLDDANVWCAGDRFFFRDHD